MKILVTGGSGFIGKAFLKKYRKAFNIVAPTHAQVDIKDARAVDALFAKHKFDAVVHLASVSDRDVSDNLVMFKNIQYLSIVHGVKKLIIVGEGAEFDSRQAIVDFSESMIGESIPTDSYGLARYMINILASKDKITTSLRVFDVYGAGGKGVIDKIVTAAARGRKITIDRDRTVSAICVDDLVKVIAGFLKGNIKQGDYNLVSGDKTSYLEIAKSVKRMAKRDGKEVEIVVKNPVPALEYTANNSKLLAAYPFKPITVKAGIKKMYNVLTASK